MIESPNAHDLLRIDPEGASALSRGAVFSSVPLDDFPFVVVRRSRQNAGLIPIGIRGRERHERSAAWIAPQHVIERISPESIEARLPLPSLPAFDSYVELKRLWRGLDLPWGPGGSVGFQLVSGCSVVHDKSDLDIVVRSAKQLTPELLRALVGVDEQFFCPVDIQVETPHGAFAIREYVNSPSRCLLRTVDGPRLVADPWLPQAGRE
jgi:phosphoribosyl-dephospho-CoA transferase